MIFPLRCYVVRSGSFNARFSPFVVPSGAKKKGGKEKEKIVKFFKAGGEGRDVPNFLDEVRYLVVDNDSRSLAFSSRRIERLAKIEEAFCSIFARWNIDAEDQRKRCSKKTKHVSVSWNVGGGIEAGGQSLQRIRIAH